MRSIADGADTLGDATRRIGEDSRSAMGTKFLSGSKASAEYVNWWTARGPRDPNRRV
jgi:hypothetical protein